MAKDKKGFVLYTDLIHTVKKLPQEQQAKLFVHILEYVNDLNPKTKDILVDIAFESVKQQLKRDLKKYENICNRNKTNGSKGGRPTKPKQPTGLIGNPKEPKQPDIDIVNDIDKVRVLLNAHTSWKELTQKNNKISDKDFKRLVESFLPNLKEENKDPEQKRHFTQWLKYQEWKREEIVIPHWNENRDK